LPLAEGAADAEEDGVAAPASGLPLTVAGERTPALAVGVAAVEEADALDVVADVATDAVDGVAEAGAEAAVALPAEGVPSVGRRAKTKMATSPSTSATIASGR